jgi:hypothetical protein
MSRIPDPDRLKLAEHVQAIPSFPERIKALQDKMSPRAAALCALHYEAVATIRRLAELVDRGGNSVLIDKAAVAIRQWNQLVTEARGVVKSG